MLKTMYRTSFRLRFAGDESNERQDASLDSHIVFIRMESRMLGRLFRLVVEQVGRLRHAHLLSD
jgi:hypothetical protein